MKYKTFINKMTKRLGVSNKENLQIESGSWSGYCRKEWLVHGDTIASWRVELKDWDNQDSELVATSFHTKGIGQESDPYTDYYPGTYWSNATQLINRLKDPPAKYPAGSLVRGKAKNKRAMRMGYAGKTALVTKSSGNYMSLQFVDDDWYCSSNGFSTMTYPVRDFELISG